MDSLANCGWGSMSHLKFLKNILLFYFWGHVGFVSLFVAHSRDTCPMSIITIELKYPYPSFSLSHSLSSKIQYLKIALSVSRRERGEGDPGFSPNGTSRCSPQHPLSHFFFEISKAWPAPEHPPSRFLQSESH